MPYPTALRGTPTLPVITPGHLQAIGLHLAQFGVTGTSPASWPAANRAIFVPFVVTAPVLARELFIVDNASGSGTFDLGIYDPDGVRLVSTGAITTGATWQTVAIPDTLLAPSSGYYYMAACRSNTGTTNVYATGSVIRARITGLAKADLGSAVLPSLATLASVVDDLIPNMGVCTQPITL
jgi:hypothetical protein